MRIHTSRTIDANALRDCIRRAASKAPAVTITVTGEHRSNSHDRAFEIALRGHGSRHTKRPNTGLTGAGDEYAATYDDWGWFLAALYADDPTVKAGPYKDRRDFERQTHGAYRF